MAAQIRARSLYAWCRGRGGRRGATGRRASCRAQAQRGRQAGQGGVNMLVRELLPVGLSARQYSLVQLLRLRPAEDRLTGRWSSLPRFTRPKEDGSLRTQAESSTTLPGTLGLEIVELAVSKHSLSVRTVFLSQDTETRGSWSTASEHMPDLRHESTQMSCNPAQITLCQLMIAVMASGSTRTATLEKPWHARGVLSYCSTQRSRQIQFRHGHLGC